MSEAGGVEDGGGSAAENLVVPELVENPTPDDPAEAEAQSVAGSDGSRGRADEGSEVGDMLRVILAQMETLTEQHHMLQERVAGMEIERDDKDGPAPYPQLKTPVGVYNGNLGRRATLVFSRGGRGSAVGTSGDHCEDEASVGRGGLYVETTALRAPVRGNYDPESRPARDAALSRALSVSDVKVNEESVRQAASALQGSLEDLDVGGFLQALIDGMQHLGVGALADRCTELLGLPTVVAQSRGVVACEPLDCAHERWPEVTTGVTAPAFANQLLSTLSGDAFPLEGSKYSDEDMQWLWDDTVALKDSTILCPQPARKGVYDVTPIVHLAARVLRVNEYVLRFVRAVAGALHPHQDAARVVLEEIHSQGCVAVSRLDRRGALPCTVAGVATTPLMLALRQSSAGVLTVANIIRRLHRPRLLALAPVLASVVNPDMSCLVGAPAREVLRVLNSCVKAVRERGVVAESLPGTAIRFLLVASLLDAYAEDGSARRQRLDLANIFPAHYDAINSWVSSGSLIGWLLGGGPPGFDIDIFAADLDTALNAPNAQHFGSGTFKLPSTFAPFGADGVFKLSARPGSRVREVDVPTYAAVAAVGRAPVAASSLGVKLWPSGLMDISMSDARNLSLASVTPEMALGLSRALESIEGLESLPDPFVVAGEVFRFPRFVPSKRVYDKIRAANPGLDGSRCVLRRFLTHHGAKLPQSRRQSGAATPKQGAGGASMAAVAADSDATRVLIETEVVRKLNELLKGQGPPAKPEAAEEPTGLAVSGSTSLGGGGSRSRGSDSHWVSRPM